jgi:arylsulfatase A-like enzyme
MLESESLRESETESSMATSSGSSSLDIRSAVPAAVISKAMIHVTDWFPTIVHGIAGLPVNIPADGTPALDGVSAWPAITGKNETSQRTEMLLNLIPSAGPGKAGQGAIRVGKWKLLHGDTCRFDVWQGALVLFCGHTSNHA